MRETEIDRGGRVLRVRDAGEPGGSVVMYFHGTPGSRLDLSFGEQLAAEHGVRLVSFDRPGYGGSTPAPFGLASVAADAHAVADGLGVDRFATLGMSGGGPGALATATVPGDRVTRAGVASGAGPFQLVPGALDSLDDSDRAALTLLPGDPAAAAAALGAGFEPLAELARESGGSGVAAAFADLLSPRDSELMADQRLASAFAATMHEALRQGTSGGGWDNVSWLGDWDVDLGAVRCPALLWYGTDDRFAPLAHGRYLAEKLPDAQLVLREGEGHLGIYEHLGEMLDALTQPGTE
ncbi:MAG TPA: alpha/beta hydrolase [Streptosporangiaceae bacterium]|nr:alpha/beta hydrolase [Streptosporangiaceae bacterium]